MLQIVLLTIILCLIFYFIKKSLFDSKLPPNTKDLPCEYGLPFFGIIFNIKPTMYHYYYELTKKYGSIFKVKLGTRTIVVVNDYNSFKKCFKENGDAFSGRWMTNLNKDLTHNAGIIFQDGHVWANSRSFTLKVLKDFGVGKSRSIEIVKSECDSMIDDLLDSNGNITDLEQIVPYYTLNIISKFIMNRHYNKNDADILFLADVIHRTLRIREPLQILDMMYPFLSKIPLYNKISLRFYEETENFKRIDEIFLKEIEYHKENLNQKSEPEDLMDRFIIEQQKYKENQEPAEFTNLQLIQISFELFSAGYETTSTTLIWTMFFLSYHSNIQEKVYKEIEEIIGNERKPEMNDKKDLHYTQAVMDECLRLSSVAPLAIFHRTIKGCIIDNFYISNNTVVMPNIYGCHRDSSVWEKPFEFYPEHFLTADRKYRAREELVAFGIGKRQCLGENLARIEYFLFLIRIIQTFRVELANLITQEEFDDCMLSTDSIIRGSKIKDFRFIRRK